MIYKTFEEWKAGQWLEDGEPRTKAYTKDELLLIEMGWQYGFDARKANQQAEIGCYKIELELHKAMIQDLENALRKAQEK